MSVDNLVVIMGVSGCGKSTVGNALASHLGWPFIEGDDHHPPANVAKMSGGEPLTDLDRAAWLDSILEAVARGKGAGLVLACSALTPYVQGRLKQARVGNLNWVLLELSREAALDRMERRQHFMPPELIDSQLDALSPPSDAMLFDADIALDELVAAIAARI